MHYVKLGWAPDVWCSEVNFLSGSRSKSRRLSEVFRWFISCSYKAVLENFKAYQFAKEYYWCCKSLKIPRFLQDQLLRASSSVALNLSEGCARRTPADQRKHYTIAFASLQECRSILELEKIENKKLMDLGKQLSAILFTLSRKKIEIPKSKNFT